MEEKNNNFLSDSDFEIACLNLKDISTKFLIQDGENDSIVAIINRYKIQCGMIFIMNHLLILVIERGVIL